MNGSTGVFFFGQGFFITFLSSNFSNFFVFENFALRFSENVYLILIHPFPGSFCFLDASVRPCIQFIYKFIGIPQELSKFHFFIGNNEFVQCLDAHKHPENKNSPEMDELE